MPTPAARLLIALAALCLSGCFDLREEIVLNADGSGQVELVVTSPLDVPLEERAAILDLWPVQLAARSAGVIWEEAQVRYGEEGLELRARGVFADFAQVRLRTNPGGGELRLERVELNEGELGLRQVVHLGEEPAAKGPKGQEGLSNRNLDAQPRPARPPKDPELERKLRELRDEVEAKVHLLGRDLWLKRRLGTGRVELALRLAAGVKPAGESDLPELGPGPSKAARRGFVIDRGAVLERFDEVARFPLEFEGELSWRQGPAPAEFAARIAKARAAWEERTPDRSRALEDHGDMSVEDRLRNHYDLGRRLEREREKSR